MSNEIKHPFTPGTEVAVVSRPRWGGGVSFRRVKVAKLHKTGRFTLEGSPDQYSATHKWGNREWIAHKSGDRWGSSLSVEMETEELRKEVEEYARKVEFQGLCDQIGTFRDRSDVSPEHINAVKAALRVLHGEP